MSINKAKAELLANLDNKLIFTDELMSKHTSFKIGGPADIFVVCSNKQVLQTALNICTKHKVSYFVIGNGTNLLVNDNGFRGIILQVDKNFNEVIIDGNKVFAQSGILLSALSKKIANAGLEGFEFGAGIPGTLGGAIFMNAGAYGGEIKDVVTGVELMDIEGNTYQLNTSEMKFGYRKSILHSTNDIVLNVNMEFKFGNVDKIFARIKELNNKRKQKQPLNFPSAGSTFKRPEGYYAGKLIMDTGLRGCFYGDAQISEKHCGFIVNKDKASASDVINLIHYVQKRVNEKFNVLIQPEIKLLGEYGIENIN